MELSVTAIVAWVLIGIAMPDHKNGEYPREPDLIDPWWRFRKWFGGTVIGVLGGVIGGFASGAMFGASLTAFADVLVTFVGAAVGAKIAYVLFRLITDSTRQRAVLDARG